MADQPSDVSAGTAGPPAAGAPVDAGRLSKRGRRADKSACQACEQLQARLDTLERLHEKREALLEALAGDLDALAQRGHARAVALVEMPDEALALTRCADEDCEICKDSFNLLFARHGRAMRGHALARSRSEADADEVAQDAWLELWRHRHQYSSTRAVFRAFAIHWVRRCLVRFYSDRKDRLQTELCLDDLRGDLSDAEFEDLLSRRSAQGSVMASAEANVERNARYEWLLKELLAGANPPHQLLAFCFCKLLDWKPREVVQELSDTPLRQLAIEAKTGYMEVGALPSPVVNLHCVKLDRRMELRFEDAVADRKTLETYPGLFGRIVGDTTFRDYYTGSTTDAQCANVSEWWWAVFRRLVAAAVNDGGRFWP